MKFNINEWVKTQDKLNEKVDHIDDKEAATKFDDLKDKDIDNDGDTDKSDKYLHKKLGTVAKKTEEVDEAAPRMKPSKEFENVKKIWLATSGLKKGGAGNRYGREFDSAKKRALKALNDMMTYAKIGI